MGPTTSYLDRPWRVGSDCPWNVYAVLGDNPSRDDPPLAVALNSLPIAEVVAYTIVTEHNRRLDEQKRA